MPPRHLAVQALNARSPAFPSPITTSESVRAFSFLLPSVLSPNFLQCVSRRSLLLLLLQPTLGQLPFYSVFPYGHLRFVPRIVRLKRGKQPSPVRIFILCLSSYWQGMGPQCSEWCRDLFLSMALLPRRGNFYKLDHDVTVQCLKCPYMAT